MILITFEAIKWLSGILYGHLVDGRKLESEQKTFGEKKTSVWSPLDLWAVVIH